MKIGIFDSGLGGLLIAEAIREHLPQYDYIYLGDTLHVPYGKRSAAAITEYTKRSIQYLFDEDCQLVILACNTASAAALRTLQQQYLPQTFPERRILGVVVPMIETALSHKAKNIGLIGTDFLIRSKIYEQELTKIDPNVKLLHKATPLLVPLLESHASKWIEPILRDYITPLIENNIDALMLGCTHYAALVPHLQNMLPAEINILSQHEIIPPCLEDYLYRHQEHENKLSKTANIRYLLTDITDDYDDTIAALLGKHITFEHISTL